MAGCYEYGNELPGSIKWGQFLDYMRNRKLLRKDSVP